MPFSVTLTFFKVKMMCVCTSEVLFCLVQMFWVIVINPSTEDHVNHAFNGCGFSCGKKNREVYKLQECCFVLLQTGDRPATCHHLHGVPESCVSYHERGEALLLSAMGNCEFLLSFFFLFSTTVLSIGISPMGNSGCFPRGEPAATVTLPYGACGVL